MLQRLRNTVVVVAFVVAAGTAYAQSPVTIVKLSGERITGQFADLHNNYIYLLADEYREPRIPLHDVAMIDFEGSGRLTDDERLDNERLNNDRWAGARDERGPHLLVMRNGRRVSGEFIGPAQDGRDGRDSRDGRESMGRGVGRNPSYLFRAANGRVMSFTPARAARLYLNRDRATSDMTDEQLSREIPFVVSSQEAWTRTDLTVRRGDLLLFRASGDVQLSMDDNDRARPGGSYSGRRAPGAPLRDAPAGALIGRVGSTVFLIGDGQDVRIPASGELWLGINDDHFGDNRGTYQVRVRRDYVVSQ